MSAVMHRPSTMNLAFRDAVVMPSASKRLVKTVAKAAFGGRGRITIRPRTLKSDGPRPPSAPPPEKTIWSHLRGGSQ